MKRALLAATAVVGIGLVAAAGVVLVEGDRTAPAPSIVVASPVAAPVDDTPLRVLDPQLVVNSDGSGAVGARVRNPRDVEVSLMGVTVSVDGRRVPVNGTQMWLPVPADDDAWVGAASDAGGFVLPEAPAAATPATLEFWFDDGGCVAQDVQAVARGDEHRLVYPKRNRTIGPETTSKPPEGAATCAS
ncbi:hypothetical protein AERO_06610 [Aeromicrobium fastidiosum]|uniref:hypothetical protein n=1 Tax=Aeromicrobium fastidiosum TaxID=52699 RepID=UPI0020232DD6|nr:hypothetical protein [Aeromicrobium fastidiosum]MCL8251048.1 hypothetical protein [Aeromicrobium fastidiosum]